MMSTLNKLFHDDLKKYKYLMTYKELNSYHIYKAIYMCIGMLLSFIFGYLMVGFTFMLIVLVLLGALIGIKVPFILLTFRHKQRINLVIDAIPIWVNMIYSLIGENNIYNAIVLSYEDSPQILKNDLKEFIDKININNDDKDAYMNYLDRYNIEGFRDIMMKLYEFRNLSKEKLKYEISSLNETLGNLEKIKRQRRFTNETFMVDILTVVLMTIPCMYLFFVSLLLSEIMM